MTSDYRPIACAAYDVIEVLAMRKTPVLIDYAQEGESQLLQGIVADTSIHDGAEYLVLQQGNTHRELRLDYLVRILSQQEGAVFWEQSSSD